MPRFLRAGALVFLAVLLFIFGLGAFVSGLGPIQTWEAISPQYAAYAVLWMFAAAALVAASVWLIASRLRNTLPLRIGSVAALLCGASIVIGTLTYVIPCAGPS